MKKGENLKSVKEHNKKAMTLVELIVVLSIIVAIASVAIVSMDGINDNSRYSETLRRGKLVEKVIEGDGAFTGRFVSDMGRLPYVINPVPQAFLAEIFYSADLYGAFDASMKYRTSDFTNTTSDWGGLVSSGSFNFPLSVRPLKLECGWRGPYLSVSKKSFYDGWGNSWHLKISSDNTWSGVFSETGVPLFGKGIFGIKSLGKNNQKDITAVDWENADLGFDFEINSVLSELNIQIYYADSSVSPRVFRLLDSSFIDHVRVAVFAPYITHDNDASDNVKRILAINNMGTKSLSVKPLEDSFYPHKEDDRPALWDGVHGVTLYNISPGYRKIYVYGFKGASSSVNKMGSSLMSVDLHPGMNLVNVYLTEGL